MLILSVELAIITIVFFESCDSDRKGASYSADVGASSIMDLVDYEDSGRDC